MTKEYEFHPYASILPLMGQQETRELAADIQSNGLRSDIVLLDGKILDGRNRYKACEIVGVDPRFRDFNGEGDPLDFIVSVNVRRRHLTSAQREMVAARIANMPRGDISRFSEQSSHTAKRQNGKKTVAEAAKDLDVSPRNVARAKEVLRTAPAEEIAAIDDGKKKVGTVARETKAKLEAKQEHLDRTGYPIPDSVLSDWQRAAEWSKAILNLVSQSRAQLKAALEDEDLILAELSNATVADLNNAYTSLKCVVPYVVCTTCQGRQPKKCSLCKGRGFISEFAWKTYVPKEAKAIREKAVRK